MLKPQASGPSPEDLELQSVTASIRLDPRVKEKHLASCNFADVYGKSATLHRRELRAADLEAGSAALSASKVDTGGAKLTYQQLVEAPTLVRAVDMVAQVGWLQPVASCVMQRTDLRPVHC